jgi:SAM-dependent methyltransferase
VNPALLDGPLVAAMRECLYQTGESLPDASLPEIREAMEALPLEAWRVMNDALFTLMAGNIFDDKPVPIDGGGLRFDYPSTRIGEFLGWVQEASPPGHPTVLDVGCWHGTLICELLQRGYYACGTDTGLGDTILQERLTCLKPEHRDRFCGYKRGWAHEVLAKMYPQSFDLVVSEQTLEHVPAAVLQATCHGMQRVAKHAILIDVPGWDDGFPFHLRCYTPEDLERLFVRDGWRMEVLRPPDVWQYTTVKVVRT